MHRFFLPPSAIHGDSVHFPPDYTHQLRAVLRLQPGAQLLVLDNAGWQYTVRLTEVRKNRAAAEILERQPAAGEPRLQLTLYQSLLKKDNFEWVLQKGTEIGVSRFVPLLTRRTLVPPAAVKPAKIARWQRIVTEAAEQCRRGRIPEIIPLQTLPGALADLAPGTTALIPWEAELETPLPRSPLPTLSAALFIGPEGGFEAAEIELAREHNCRPVTLGPRILRAETAALVGAALLLHDGEGHDD